MALYKEIVQDDGVVTCYHRILSPPDNPKQADIYNCTVICQ